MVNQKTKLERTWIGKEIRPKLEPRILLEDPKKSHHAQHRVTDHDLFDNRLIFGDNLLALQWKPGSGSQGQILGFVIQVIGSQILRRRPRSRPGTIPRNRRGSGRRARRN